MDFILFAARHEMPANSGAICANFDFKSKQTEKTALWSVALNDLRPRIYVTGLTPALTEFIGAYTLKTLEITRNLAGAGWGGEADANRVLTLLHHDRETGTYWAQYL